MPVAPNLINVALDGRYELHALIGEGTFGRVYQGRDRRLARPVAVKVIKPWWAEDPDWVRSFEREAQLLASISDPGIVQIYDVGSAPEGLYYVAELVDGESLASRLRRGPLEPLRACEVAEQLARALDRAHSKRVIHRDVKPANVLISSDGAVKVGDFGLARLVEGTSEGAGGTIVGTPRYMAPEQARGGVTTPATDVYGVGIVLYEMLAGEPPFRGTSVVELAMAHVHDPPPPLPPETPRELAAVVDRALRKDPRARYPDGGALADALARARAQAIEDADEQERDRSRPADAASGAGTSTLTPTRVLRRRATARSAPRSAPTRVGQPMSPRRNVNPSERRQRIALLAGVVTLGVAMVGLALALAPGHVKVPNLLGMTRAQIRATAKRRDFRIAFGSRYSATPAGRALSQSPAAGRTVTDGAFVAVVMSSGPAPVPVPQLVGSSASQAQAVLARSKLRGNLTQVPAPGATTGTVVRQSPRAHVSVLPGSTVALSVAEAPRWRPLTALSGNGHGRSVPFRIEGSRWQVVYSMGYRGTCTFIFICSGPTATVKNVSTGAVVDQFDLNEGSGQTRAFKSGPGVYQIAVSPGSDSAHWALDVQDYY